MRFVPLLDALFQGLAKNDLLKCYSHLLTGYIGNASFLKQVAKIVKSLRAVVPDLIYGNIYSKNGDYGLNFVPIIVCDPVMGDNDAMYVPEDLLPIYRNEIISLADIVTPNQYEVELLTEMKITTESDMWNAVQWFHNKGINKVVISSSNLGKPGDLRCFASERNGSRYVLDIPKLEIDVSFTGTGDLFASLFLAHSYQTLNLSLSLERTIASLQAVIKRTIESMPAEVREGKREPTPFERELKLIQTKNELENPKIFLRAEKIN